MAAPQPSAACMSARAIARWPAYGPAALHNCCAMDGRCFAHDCATMGLAWGAATRKRLRSGRAMGRETCAALGEWLARPCASGGRPGELHCATGWRNQRHAPHAMRRACGLEVAPVAIGNYLLGVMDG
ncbi:hypothetical protein F511_17194 [Dorcoceras hygrometricum]|uniref:Uncharacterized protein n=1 Tax=Dorcoceras hygrometricum TaxID=472368 RepID=A0A2Z7BR28_9LAMI|nr:hypothetical protein F511_17194 [Dorcoceras hygrometricum]